jgi:bla regulator protein blaR1
VSASWANALNHPWWTTIGVPLANHVWQSTLVAGIAYLNAVLLRPNQARLRHSVWIIASAKFLIPFSLLVAVGAHIGPSRTLAVKPYAVLLTVENIGQPFSSRSLGRQASGTETFVVSRVLPLALVTVWFGGCVYMLFYWWSRFRRIRSAIRESKPALSGREFEALRRLERQMGLRRPLDLIFSATTLEPGVLGIFKPVLILPTGISERLTEAQSEAILAHELCHVRRRDNLAAVIHMVVEAVFWFHPVVWWLGGRLVYERERACDEAVLLLGAEPQSYAEGILKICEFYLESPVACAVGVTGSNLKRRIEVIMYNHTPLKLNLFRKLLLGAAGFIAIAAPLVYGATRSTPTISLVQTSNVAALPTFKSVSIHENKSGNVGVRILYENDGFSATNYTLLGLLAEAYDVQENEIAAPEWMKVVRYDVTARVDSSAVAALQSLSMNQRKAMLQVILTDAFHLVSHFENRNVPVYVFLVADDGPKFHVSRTARASSMGTLTIRGAGNISGSDVPISELVGYFSLGLNRPLLDQTGLAGRYDFTLEWTADTAPGTPGSSLLTALEEQLGLKLAESTAPVEFLVIDNVAKPSEN